MLFCTAVLDRAYAPAWWEYYKAPAARYNCGASNVLVIVVVRPDGVRAWPLHTLIPYCWPELLLERFADERKVVRVAVHENGAVRPVR